MSLSGGVLEVRVLKARGLYVTQSIGKQDPFVRIRGPSLRDRYETKVHEDGHEDAVWDYTVSFHVTAGFSIAFDVINKNVVKDALIGSCFVSVDDLMAAETPGAWYRIGRNLKQCTDAGELFLAFAFVPDTRVDTIEASSEEEFEEFVDDSVAEGDVAAIRRVRKPQPQDDPVVQVVGDKPQPSPLVYTPVKQEGEEVEEEGEEKKKEKANVCVAGVWRIYSRDTLRRERSYEMTLSQCDSEGSFTGHGVAASGALTFTVAGAVRGNGVSYTESWLGGGKDFIEAEILQQGDKWRLRRDDGSLLKAKRISSAWSAETHPHYFQPYYNLSGAWRVFVKQLGKEKSYSLSVVQAADGSLTGCGIAGDYVYSVTGQVKGNVVKYTEHWSGTGGNDHVEAEIKWDGSYFVCKTTHAEMQAARLIVAMSDSEQARYHLPWTW